MRKCDCGCNKNPCKCSKKRYLALLKCSKLNVKDIQCKKVNIINYTHPSIGFETECCHVKEFGTLIGDVIRKGNRGS